jgi:hypothetical protein
LQVQAPKLALHATQSVAAAHCSAQVLVKMPQIMGALHSEPSTHGSPKFPPPPPPPGVTQLRLPSHSWPEGQLALLRQPVRHSLAARSQ